MHQSVTGQPVTQVGSDGGSATIAQTSSAPVSQHVSPQVRPLVQTQTWLSQLWSGPQSFASQQSPFRHWLSQTMPSHSHVPPLPQRPTRPQQSQSALQDAPKLPQHTGGGSQKLLPQVKPSQQSSTAQDSCTSWQTAAAGVAVAGVEEVAGYRSDVPPRTNPGSISFSSYSAARRPWRISSSFSSSPRHGCRAQAERRRQ